MEGDLTRIAVVREEAARSAAAETPATRGTREQFPPAGLATTDFAPAFFAPRMHRGPIPSPESLRAYEDILPGCAERIVAYAEREQQFRHDTRKEHLRAEEAFWRRKNHYASTGQILAFIVIMSTLGLGYYFAETNRPATGLASILSALATLITAYLFSPRKPPHTAPTENNIGNDSWC
jgi:uncharacterized membrane protein